MYLKAKMMQVRKASDVPPGPHFAILVYKFEFVHIEGDERSRTSPGHGYPSHTETYETFEHYVTQDRADWLLAVEEFAMNEETKNKFVCFEVAKLAKVVTKVVVDVE